MALDLQNFWRNTATDIRPVLARKHLAGLTKTKTTTPVVHCVMHGGLLDGEPIDNPKPHHNVVALLTKLEEAGREIVIVHTTIDDIAAAELRKKLPGKKWQLRNGLDLLSEFSDRASGKVPQGELMIFPNFERSEYLPLHTGAHVSTIRPRTLG